MILTVRSTSHTLTHLILRQVYEVVIVTPIVKMRNLRHERLKNSHGSTAGKGQSQDLNSGDWTLAITKMTGR